MKAVQKQQQAVEEHSVNLMAMKTVRMIQQEILCFHSLAILFMSIKYKFIKKMLRIPNKC